MINLIHAELFQLKKSKTFYISFFVSTVCAIVMAVIANQAASGKAFSGTPVSGISDIFILSVICPLLISALVCNDFESKLIHDAVSCGRTRIVISKMLIYILLVAVVILPYAIAGVIGFATNAAGGEIPVASTFLDIMENKANLTVDGQSIGKVIVVMFVTMLSYAARISICIPIAFKVRKSVIVTVCGVIYGFIIDLVMSGLNSIDGAANIGEYLPFQYVMISVDSSNQQLLKIVCVDIIFLIIVGFVTTRMFKHAEIK